MYERQNNTGDMYAYLVISFGAPHPLHERLVREVSRVAGTPHTPGRDGREKGAAQHASVHALDRRGPEKKSGQ